MGNFLPVNQTEHPYCTRAEGGDDSAIVPSSAPVTNPGAQSSYPERDEIAVIFGRIVS